MPSGDASANFLNLGNHPLRFHLQQRSPAWSRHYEVLNRRLWRLRCGLQQLLYGRASIVSTSLFISDSASLSRLFSAPSRFASM